MIKTRFIVAIGLLMTLACCSNSGTDQTPPPHPPPNTILIPQKP